MAKRRTKAPVVISKSKFLLPKMEWMELDAETGEGFYLKSLGGDALLTFKSSFEDVEKAEGEVTLSKALDMMAHYIILSACNARGECLFTQDDFEFIRAKRVEQLVDICNIAMPLSGMVMTGLEVGVKSDLKNDLPNSSTTDLPTNLESQ